jgi:GntR family transcriptional regulator, rspAB operon transcriptional repressor
MELSSGQSFVAVHARLRAAILAGELGEGAVTSQVTLAERFGVGRTPLREALRMLQAERLIEAEPNRRVRVAPMTAADLEQLCVVRVTLEAEALRLTVPRLAPEDIAGLEGQMAAMAHFAQAKDYRRWVVPDRAFHRALTAPAGPRVNDLLGQLFDHAERYRRLHLGYGPTAWATAGHREILDACKSGDRERSAGLLASHIARTGFEVIEILEPGYVPADLQDAVRDVGGEVPGPRKRRRKA